MASRSPPSCFGAPTRRLTITGYTLDTIHELTNIDRLLDWAVAWGERRRAAAAPAEPVDGNGSFSSNGCGYSVEQIEHIVCAGPPQGANRSDLFHAIIGHYLGCGWDCRADPGAPRAAPLRHQRALLAGGPAGTRNRAQHQQIRHRKLPLLADWTSSWEAKAPQPEPQTQEPVSDDLELQDDLDGDDMPDAEQPATAQDDQPDDDPGDEDLGDDHSVAADDDDLDNEELSEGSVNLPPMFAHGDPDPRPLKRWLIKRLIPVCGHGLLSGQWGAGKTFMALELGASVRTGQPFLGHLSSGNAACCSSPRKGRTSSAAPRCRRAGQVRRYARAPFRWYEAAPVLLRKGTVETLVAMAKQAEASLQQEFGMPLGLIFIDTITASAGYSQPGAENDNGVGQHLMNVLKTVGKARIAS